MPNPIYALHTITPQTTKPIMLRGGFDNLEAADQAAKDEQAQTTNPIWAQQVHTNPAPIDRHLTTYTLPRGSLDELFFDWQMRVHGDVLKQAGGVYSDEEQVSWLEGSVFMAQSLKHGI